MSQLEETIKKSGFKREVSCFFVPGKEILSVTTNDSAGMVEFDFFTIWEKLKQIEYSQVCMIHSHPSGFPTMSGTDWNMVYGWVQAIGKPVLFVIITDTESTYYLCQRDVSDKNIVNREIVNWCPNFSFKELCDVIYYLSIVDNCPSKDQMDKVAEILNDIKPVSFREANIGSCIVNEKFVQG